jgi:hypothetical protein
MRLSVFIIALLTITDLFGQTDSIARIRKPVLAHLIGEHYRAENLSAENNTLRNQANEMQFQIEQYKKIIITYRKDSLLCDSLIALHEQTGISWKESYEVEKRDHVKTKRKLKGWKLMWFGLVAVEAVILVRSLP